MRKLMLVPLIATMLVACGGPSGPIAWHKGNYSDALAEAGRRDTLVMLDFYTDW